MKKTRQHKIATSFRLSRDAYDLLQGLVKSTGLARTACLELAIRQLASFGVRISGPVTAKDKRWFDAQVARLTKEGL